MLSPDEAKTLAALEESAAAQEQMMVEILTQQLELQRLIQEMGDNGRSQIEKIRAEIDDALRDLVAGRFE